MIRQATEKDIESLLDMGERFAAYAPFDVEFSRDATADFLKQLTQSNGVVLVSERSGAVVGALIGILSHIWYSPTTMIAVELAWWVDPEYRGVAGAAGLVKAFEEWGKDRGASAISLCDMCIDGEFPVGSMLGRLGYRVSERTHVKEV